MQSIQPQKAKIAYNYLLCLNFKSPLSNSSESIECAAKVQ